MSTHLKNLLHGSHLKTDLSAGLVIFLVALPLCLGIALASGALFLVGLINGIIGGIISKSPLSLSGPAAGFTLIVSEGIAKVRNYSLFSTAVVLAGEAPEDEKKEPAR